MDISPNNKEYKINKEILENGDAAKKGSEDGIFSQQKNNDPIKNKQTNEDKNGNKMKKDLEDNPLAKSFKGKRNNFVKMNIKGNFKGYKATKVGRKFIRV